MVYTFGLHTCQITFCAHGFGHPTALPRFFRARFLRCVGFGPSVMVSSWGSYDYSLSIPVATPPLPPPPPRALYQVYYYCVFIPRSRLGWRRLAMKLYNTPLTT